MRSILKKILDEILRKI